MQCKAESLGHGLQVTRDCEPSPQALFDKLGKRRKHAVAPGGVGFGRGIGRPRHLIDREPNSLEQQIQLVLVEADQRPCRRAPQLVSRLRKSQRRAQPVRSAILGKSRPA